MLFSGYLTEHGLRGGPGRDGWATVGDLGALRDGHLSLAGRASDTIVTGGLNVEPAEVEAALATLPGVAAVACVALPDARWGEIPVAVLVPAAPCRRRRAARRPSDPRRRPRPRRATLPPPSRPRRVFVVARLPLSPRGKLLRGELAATLLSGAATELR